VGQAVRSGELEAEVVRGIEHPVAGRRADGDRAGAVAAEAVHRGADREISSRASGRAGVAEHARARGVEPGVRCGRIRVEVPACNARARRTRRAGFDIDVQAIDVGRDDEIGVRPVDDARVGGASDNGRGSSGCSEVLRETIRQHGSLFSSSRPNGGLVCVTSPRCPRSGRDP